MDCSEASITREFYRLIRSTNGKSRQKALGKFEELIYNKCGKDGEDQAILLRTIVYTAVESNRSRFTLIHIGTRIKSYFKGDKVMRDKTVNKIKARDIINSQVGQTLTNCSNIIQQQPAGEKKTLLDQLQTDVKSILDTLPQDKKDKESEIADYLKAIVEQSTGKAPANRRFYTVSAEGLLEASKWCKDFAGNIFGTIGQLGKMLWPDFSVPKSS